MINKFRWIRSINLFLVNSNGKQRITKVQLFKTNINASNLKIPNNLKKNDYFKCSKVYKPCVHMKDIEDTSS
jgi:hypothetical protein